MTISCLIKEPAIWAFKNYFCAAWKLIPRLLLNGILGTLMVLAVPGACFGILWFINPALAFPRIIMLTLPIILCIAIFLGGLMPITAIKTILDVYDQKQPEWLYVSWFKTMLRLFFAGILFALIIAIPLLSAGFLAHRYLTEYIAMTPLLRYAVLGGFFLLMLGTYTLITRFWFAPFSIIDRAKGAIAGLQESWHITSFAKKFFFALAILLSCLALIVIITAPALIPLIQIKVAILQDPGTLGKIIASTEPWTAWGIIANIITILVAFWAMLFAAALYRKLSACSTGTTQSCCK
jgi:hypothetical protein